MLKNEKYILTNTGRACIDNLTEAQPQPNKAINTASYYSTIPEQGASIFKTIIKNHMFIDGNKRTAVEMFKLFCSKSGIKNVITDGQLMEIATKVAISEVDDVLEISKLLIK